MTPESRLKNAVEIELSRRGYIPLRLNVGRFFTEDGRPIRTGLPKGTADLLFIQPGTGRAVFIETKTHPRKPTAEQLNFISVMQRQGALTGVAYTVDDALKIIENN